MNKSYRQNELTNDILLKIMQNTYLFKAKKVDLLISEAYFRYLNILDYINIQLKNEPSKEDLIKLYKLAMQARVILYFIGHFFTEEFGREAIEKRLNLLDILPLDFYTLIDQNITIATVSKEKAYYLNKLINFYKVLKYWKQKLPERGKLYLDEDYFDKTLEEILDRLDLA